MIDESAQESPRGRGLQSAVEFLATGADGGRGCAGCFIVRPSRPDYVSRMGKALLGVDLQTRLQNVAPTRFQSAAAERPVPGQHFVEHQPERVYIAFRSNAAAL